MLKRKNIKNRGKLGLSQYFQEFEIGQKVAIVREHSLNPAFPKRIQGLTGNVIGTKGKAYIIRALDGKEAKDYIIMPMHLKKIK